MKNVSTIACLIEAPDESLAVGLSRGTGVRLCPVVAAVPMRPVVRYHGRLVRPSIPESFGLAHRHASLITQVGLLLGPVLYVWQALLAMMGCAQTDMSDDSCMVRAAQAFDADMDALCEHAVYWHNAIKVLLPQIERAHAKGRGFNAPDWFIWLQRFGVGVSPARLRAAMVRWSISGHMTALRLTDAQSLVAVIRNLRGLDSLTPVGDNDVVSVRSLTCGYWRVHLPPD